MPMHRTRPRSQFISYQYKNQKTEPRQAIKNAQVEIRNASRVQHHIKEQKRRKDSGVLAWKHCQTGKFHASLTTVVFFLILHFNSLLVLEITVIVIPFWNSFQKTLFLYSVAIITSQHDSEKLQDG